MLNFLTETVILNVPKYSCVPLKTKVIVHLIASILVHVNRQALNEKLSVYIREPAIAAIHGPHSPVRIGPGCAGRA